MRVGCNLHSVWRRGPTLTALLFTLMMVGAEGSAQVFCRLQFPGSATVPTGGDTVTVFGRVFVAGITDQSSVNDPDPSVVAEVGVGPNGNDPTVSLAGWVFQSAIPNPGWEDSPDPNLDEYVADLVSPITMGMYDYAYRFSDDFGASFTYCDLGNQGSNDGYQVVNAGDLSVVSSGVVPVPALKWPTVLLLAGILLGFGALALSRERSAT